MIAHIINSERRIKIMSTAVGRTVFVLGKQVHGNRQVIIVEDGEEYSFDHNSTVQAYTAQTARFPYELA